jgi:hypothetical protein
MRGGYLKGGKMMDSAAYRDYRNYTAKRVAYARFRVGSTWTRAQISNISILDDGTVRIKIPLPVSNATVNRVEIFNSDGERWDGQDCKLEITAQEEGYFWYDITISAA